MLLLLYRDTSALLYILNNIALEQGNVSTTDKLQPLFNEDTHSNNFVITDLVMSVEEVNEKLIACIRQFYCAVSTNIKPATGSDTMYYNYI